MKFVVCCTCLLLSTYCASAGRFNAAWRSRRLSGDGEDGPTTVGFNSHILSKHRGGVVPSLLFSISKKDEGEYKLEKPFVDVVFRAFEHEDEHDHGDEHEEDDHEEDEHDEDEEHKFEEIKTWYEGKTDAQLAKLCNITVVASTITVDIKEGGPDMSCYRLFVNNRFFSSNFPIMLGPAGDAIELFALAFPLVEHDEDEHDGHDHDEHDEHDEMQAQFNIVDASDGKMLKKENTYTEGEFECLVCTKEAEAVAPAEENYAFEAILGAVIVNLCTLAGVALIPFLAHMSSQSKSKNRYYSKDSMSRATTVALSSFSAGAILSCALLLLMPESIALLEEGFHDPNVDPHTERRLQDGHDGHDHGSGTNSEVEEEVFIAEIPIKVVWVWGTALMAGFLVSYIIDFLSPHQDVEAEVVAGHEEANGVNGIEMANKDAENGIVQYEGVKVGDERSGKIHTEEMEMLEPNRRARQRLIFGVLLGDFVHNIVDGFFIGFAFKDCDTMGWTVAAATVAHEVPQKLADFYLLVTYGALPVTKALFYNFLCGTSVLWGTIIIWNTDVSDEVMGFFLALGAGVYLQVACAESMARASQNTVTRREQLIMLSAFAIGATLVGLVLLNHQHC